MRTTSPIDLILSRLEKPKSGYKGQWLAICPAHKDKSPSLSIRETDQGAVLIHCFAGCTVLEVTDSLGINMKDLYPPRYKSGKEPNKIPSKITSTQVVELMDKELLFLSVCALNMSEDIELTEVDRNRLILAASRLAYLREESKTRSHGKY